MGLETATLIHQLLSANPEQEDLRRQGDDHLRMIKAALIATLVNIQGVVNASHTELNLLVGATSLPNVTTGSVVLDFTTALAAGASRTFTKTLAGTLTTDILVPLPGSPFSTYPGLIVTSWRPLTGQVEVTVVNAGASEVPSATNLTLDLAVVR